MNGFRLYGRMVGATLRSQMQYRASFVMHMLGNALAAFIEFLGIWAMFARFGALEGWTLAEAAVFYGMSRTAFGLCEMFARGFDIFDRTVREGGFDKLLVRPRGTVLMVLGSECQLMRIGQMIQGIIVMTVGLSMLDVLAFWHAGHWLLLALAILGGAFLFSAINVLQATSAFWTVQSMEAWNCITYGGVQLIQYPIDIYERPLRFVFTYLVPLVAVSYWPCAYLLGRGYVQDWLSWLAPGIGIASFFLSLLVWRWGVRHYRSTGS